MDVTTESVAVEVSTGFVSDPVRGLSLIEGSGVCSAVTVTVTTLLVSLSSPAVVVLLAPFAVVFSVSLGTG